MTILVIGLGSMGKRRIRNLRALQVEDVVGVDLRADRRAEAAERYGVRTFADVEEALAQPLEAAVISLPPDLHFPFAMRAARRGVPFFMEASVTSAGGQELVEAMRETGVIGFPSCTMRLFPGPKAIADIVRSGRLGVPRLWNYHVGQWLPDWHPWEDISEFYVSKRETGGAREITAFELNWLADLFGPVADLEARVDHVSNLQADIDDLYMLQMRHRSGVYGHLTVDVISRAPVRSMRLTCSEGTAVWESAAHRVSTYSVMTKEWTHLDLAQGTVEAGYAVSEEPYVEEMRMFLSCVRTRKQPAYTVQDDLRHLELLYTAEASARAGVRRAAG